MDIRLTTPEDAEMLAAYFLANESHFQPWEPIREHGYYNAEALKTRLIEYERQHLNGTAAHFVGVIDNQIAAHCFLTNNYLWPPEGLRHGVWCI